MKLKNAVSLFSIVASFGFLFSGGPSGCGGSLFLIAGTVSGLSGTLLLTNNNADDLTVSADGDFTFTGVLADGADYDVTVKTQPSGQICTVANGKGTIDGKNVEDVAVDCGDAVGLSVAVSGAGNGTVTSDTGGIDCDKSGGTCNATYKSGTEVALTAAADTGFVFAGWSGGGCTGAGDCVVTVDEAQSVRATFLMVVFSSLRKPDGTDAKDPNDTSNVWVVQTDGLELKPLAPTTAVGTSSSSPQWSPDGTQIAFSSGRSLLGTNAANDNDTSNIWVVNADGTGGPRHVTDTKAVATSNFSAQWSPDGTQFVFSSSRGLDGNDDANNNNTSNIWVVNTDGTGGLRHITDTKVTETGNFSPLWSPDGTKILFLSKRKLDGTDALGPNGDLNIWVVDAADGSNLHALAGTETAGVGNGSPDWSPDGSQVVFTSTRKLDGSDNPSTNNASNIWVVNADGTGGLHHLTAVTTLFAGGGSPQWSPDGTQILFSSARELDGGDAASANFADNLWVVNADADGSGLHHLTSLTVSTNVDGGQWSPDGTHAVYNSRQAFDGSDGKNANLTPNIWTVDVSSFELFHLTKTEASDADSFDPDWSF